MMVEKKKNYLEEQETVFALDYVNKRCQVYSSKPAVCESLMELLRDHPEEVKLLADDEYGTMIEIPNKWVKIKPPRAYSEERRQQMAEAMKMLNDKRRIQK